MRALKIRIFFVLLAIIATAGLASASPVDSKYEALKSRYMRLRNTDKEIARKSEWLGIISELEAFARHNKNYKNAAVALSQAGGMSLEMYKGLGSKSELNKSRELFELILSDFPASSEADDALIKLSEIHADYLNDEEAASEALKRLLKEYPSGDMYEVALIRLKQIEDGGHVEKDEDNDEEENEKQDLSGDRGKVYKVIIDPGHGGEDFGAVGVGGLYEKDVVLDISLKLKKILESKYNINVKLTRAGDEFVPLYARTAMANDENADVFVSIHANASEKKNLQGFEIYYLDNTSDKASKKLADRENASMQFEGPEADLRYMISDLIQDSKAGDSLRLAGVLGSAIIGGMSQKGYKIKDHGIKKAPFYVLVGAYMPCVLVEIGFIDHAEEGQKLADKAFRNAMSQVFAEGIVRFLPAN